MSSVPPWPLDSVPPPGRLDHLAFLESEAIHALREAVAECARPVLLFSGGKDSACLLRLAEKAFRPSPLPFPLLSIDTGHEFPELGVFRDRRAAELGARLIVRSVDDALAAGTVEPRPGEIGRNRLQIPVLLASVAEFGFDALFGGARRDEEKSRAKERFFSFRDAWGQWDPRAQRPEPWNLYNARVRPGEHLRVFPLSNWTELDVWEYIARERLDLPSLYFSHRRLCVRRRGQWFAVTPLAPPVPGEEARELWVRVRTIGDVLSTALTESPAADVAAVLAEVRAARVTERSARADDRDGETAMEDRKREGYF